MLKEISGNMFSSSLLKFADVICITTNGFVKKNGRAVMGAGNAKQARDMFKDIDLDFGKALKENGNIVQIIRYENLVDKELPIVSFPVKHNWWEMADLELIRNSLKQLLIMMIYNDWKKVILPRLGCSNGKLNWLSEVRPLLEEYLDERVYVVDRSLN